MPFAEMFVSWILEFWDLSEDIPWLFVPGSQGRYDWCFTQAFKHHFTADGSQKEEEEHVCASGLCMCGFACLCVQIIFARRSATLNDLLHRTVDHDPLSPVLELGDLCLQAPQSSLLFSLTSSSRTIHVYHSHHSGLPFAVYHSHHRVSMPARRPTSRHPARNACAPCSQAASPRHPA
jgi:hypothetical protein